MLQPSGQKADNRLIISQIIDRLKVYGHIRVQPDFLFPEASPEEREECVGYLCVMTVQIVSKIRRISPLKE